jgi:hypothetical protein
LTQPDLPAEHLAYRFFTDGLGDERGSPVRCNRHNEPAVIVVSARTVCEQGRKEHPPLGNLRLSLESVWRRFINADE